MGHLCSPGEKRLASKVWGVYIKAMYEAIWSEKVQTIIGQNCCGLKTIEKLFFRRNKHITITMVNNNNENLQKIYFSKII